RISRIRRLSSAKATISTRICPPPARCRPWRLPAATASAPFNREPWNFPTPGKEAGQTDPAFFFYDTYTITNNENSPEQRGQNRPNASRHAFPSAGPGRFNTVAAFACDPDRHAIAGSWHDQVFPASCDETGFRARGRLERRIRRGPVHKARVPRENPVERLRRQGRSFRLQEPGAGRR